MIRKLTQAELAEIMKLLALMVPLATIAETYDVPREEICKIAAWWLYTGKLVLQ